jgi:DnaJ family protein A protein 2
MFVVKQKPHPKIKRRGNDLIIEQEITLAESLCGGKFTVEFLCGQKVNMTLEPGKITKPSDIVIAENMGLPDFKNPNSRGKLYIVISVKFPKEFDESKLEVVLKVYYQELS